ncbi:hypothetical protein RB195_012489 [Necator americanus]|uniref:Serpentine receptor class gamma n=1 Tax=Necator americanus TaxID=51031 RepID=A0ABR1D7D8_NECAM
MLSKKSSRSSLSSRSSRERNKREILIFFTVSVLTSIYTVAKAVYMSMVLRDNSVGMISSYLQCLTSTAIVLLKVLHILLDAAISVFALYKGAEKSAIAVYGTFASFMDLTIYSLFLRLKMEKKN